LQDKEDGVICFIDIAIPSGVEDSLAEGDFSADRINLRQVNDEECEDEEVTGFHF